MIHTLATFAHAPLSVWMLALLAFGMWRLDVEWHPFRACRRCKGTGLNRGSRPGAHGLCVHGQRQPRLFAGKAAARQMARIERRRR